MQSISVFLDIARVVISSKKVADVSRTKGCVYVLDLL